MRIVASERVMCMLHSVSSIVRIVAFRFDLGRVVLRILHRPMVTC